MAYHPFAQRFVRHIALFSALAAVTACGDGLDEVELGEFRCLTTPCDADFGELNVNRNGQSAQIDVQNVGSGELEILSIRLENASPQVRFSQVTAQFLGTETGFDWLLEGDAQSFTNTVPYILLPNRQLEVELDFVPAGGSHGCTQGQVNGTLSCGTLVIESNDTNADNRVLRAEILATIGDTRMEVAPTIISFAPAQIVDAGAGTYATQQRTFTVTNLGTGNMVLQNIVSDSTELAIEDDSGAPFPITMIGGAERSFNVVWTPTSADPFQAQINVSSNAQEGGNRIVLVNSDGGAAADISVHPCGFDFEEVGVGASDEITFDTTNTGGAALTWSVTLTGFQPTSARDDFDIVDVSDSPAIGPQDALDPAGTRTLKVVYTPSEDRSVTGAVRFTGNFGPSFECSVSAGEAQPVASVTPRQLLWGGLAPEASEDRSFVIVNDGRADLVVSGITESGDAHDEFEVDATAAAGFTLAPGETRRVSVNYTRAAGDLPAQDTATLTIAHDGLSTSTQVFLIASHGDEFLPPTCALSVDPPEPFTVGDTVTLDATGSAVNAGEWAPNPFSWNLDRPAGSTASLSGEAGDAVMITFDEAGTYVVSMVATAVIGAESVSCELQRNLVVAAE